MAPKVFIFDLEGTLFEPHVSTADGIPRAHATGLWAQLVARLGQEAIRRDAELAAAWDRGEFGSYAEWCDASLRSMKANGLTQSIFDKAIDSYGYTAGIPELVATLHEHGVRTAIISGGFVTQAKRAQSDLHIGDIYAAVDLIWGDDGRPISWTIMGSDYGAKVAYLDQLLRKCNLLRAQCAFMGDGTNDIPLARAVPISFALNGTKELAAVTTFSVSNPLQVLKLLQLPSP